jgi:hypothetical protein
MYGLPQAGITAQELLTKRLKKHGYTKSKTMPGLWTHEWHPTTFSLVIDNFGVKIHWGRTCPAPDTNGEKILYVLIQKGRGKIFQTYHQMGLCRQEGARFYAIVH